MSRFPARWERAGFAALLLAAALVWALAPTYPNYDAYYHLVWGRELLDGSKPSFEAFSAPTEHPLYVALGAVLALAFGTDADRALVLLCALAFAALIYGTYRLGAAVFGRWAGLAAAAFVGSSFAFVLYAAKAYVDLPFLALVVWAGVLEAERRQRGWSVMALLAVAGLLRPEAWVLAGLYWLWLAIAAGPQARRTPRDLAALAVLVVAAPVLWGLTDLWVTGDPLFSLSSTSDLADELGRERGLGEVPGSFVSFLADAVRPPVFVLGVVGAALAVWRRPLRELAVPLGLFAGGVLTFVGTGVFGLSILPRYLTVPSIALCLFAGYALLGFLELPRGEEPRRWWRRATIVAAALGVLVVVLLVPRLGRLASELRFVRTTHDDLVALLDRPAVRADLRCGPLTFPTYRLVPDARWLLDRPRGRVTSRAVVRAPFGVAVVTTTGKAYRRYGRAAGISRSSYLVDPRFRPIVRAGMFAAYGRCG